MHQEHHHLAGDRAGGDPQDERPGPAPGIGDQHRVGEHQDDRRDHRVLGGRDERCLVSACGPREHHVVLPDRQDGRHDAEDRDLGLLQPAGGERPGEGEQAEDERQGQDRDDLQLPRDVAADQGVANLDQGQAGREEEDGRSKADPEQGVRFVREQSHLTPQQSSHRVIQGPGRSPESVSSLRRRRGRFSPLDDDLGRRSCLASDPLRKLAHLDGDGVRVSRVCGPHVPGQSRRDPRDSTDPRGARLHR